MTGPPFQRTHATTPRNKATHPEGFNIKAALGTEELEAAAAALLAAVAMLDAAGAPGLLEDALTAAT